MKKCLAAILVTCALATSCESSTKYGDCVGITDNKDPNLVYRISTRNVVLGVVFLQTIFTPIVVLLDEAECPVGKR